MTEPTPPPYDGPDESDALILPPPPEPDDGQDPDDVEPVES